MNRDLSEPSWAVQVRCPICASTQCGFVRDYRTILPGSTQIFSGLSIVNCQACSVSFAHPMPTEDILTAYYATAYRGQGAWHRSEREPGQWDGACVRARSQLEFVLTGIREFHKNELKINSWLDIGAGYGHLLDEAMKHGIEITGAVEPDEHGRNRLQKQGHRIYGTLCDVKDVWDVISFSHLLEHLASPLDFLDQIKNLLSEKGHAFCEVPNDSRLQYTKNDAPHLTFFSMSSLSRLFKQKDFEVLSVQTCGTRTGGNGVENVRQLSRRIAMRLFQYPPPWIDRAIHPHFLYSEKGDRAWIRLLGRKIPA